MTSRSAATAGIFPASAVMVTICLPSPPPLKNLLTLPSPPLPPSSAIRGMTTPVALAAAGFSPAAPGSSGGAALLRHMLFGAGLEMVEAIAMADEPDAAIQGEVGQ